MQFGLNFLPLFLVEQLLCGAFPFQTVPAMVGLRVSALWNKQFNLFSP